MSTVYQDAIENIRKAHRLVGTFHTQAVSMPKGNPLKGEWNTFVSEVDALHKTVEDIGSIFDYVTAPKPQKL